MIRIFMPAALVIAGAYFALGQRQAEKPAGGDARAAVEANHSKLIAAFGRRDAAAAASLYAADARLLPQGGGPVVGAEGVRSYWQGVMAAGARLVRLETLHLEERDEMAYEIGAYTVTAQSGPGTTDVHSGNYLAVWRRQPDGGWKAAASMWNSDKAAAAR